jgi:septal ring factor EnvC (AmiA/AmiB activator)
MLWSGLAFSAVPAPDQPLEAVRQDLRAARQTRDALQAVRDRLDSELAGIERRQGRIANTLYTLENEIKTRDQTLATIRKQRDGLKTAVQRQHRLLAGQLRSAHRIGSKDWLKLLLNQEEPSRMARVLAYYGYLNQARVALIRQWQADSAALEETEIKLAQETASQVAARQQLQRERAALETAVRDRRQLLTSWEAELKSQDARLKEDEQRLKALLQSVAQAVPGAPASAPATPPTTTTVAAARRGRCPPAGQVLARFGDARMSGRWDGMLIGGKEGAPVRAVAAGQIVFADWFRGYGLLLIVDHGDGIMSLYAFNQTLYKNKGERVGADEPIAALGASGGRARPGLYFGIRQQGQPVDPLTWCASRS